jgi:hypothetical protein
MRPSPPRILPPEMRQHMYHSFVGLVGSLPVSVQLQQAHRDVVTPLVLG